MNELPEVAGAAWMRLRDRLLEILGDDLVAIWAYGSVVGNDRPHRPADLDTHVIVRSRPDEATARRIEDAVDAIASDADAKFDIWFITLEDARRPEHPPHAFREGRRDTSWAIHRAHWLAGRFVGIHGLQPSEVVTPPTWDELESDLDRELEHIERHVHEGDTDPYEAAYAILNGSRVLHSMKAHDVALSKREAGIWALDQLSERWQPALHAAFRAYDEEASPEDVELLAAEMAPFVAMVREQLPPRDAREPGALPRWSGY
jgi:hypothetical protein